MSSGDKVKIKLMDTNLRKYTKGGMCRGAGAAIKGADFKRRILMSLKKMVFNKNGWILGASEKMVLTHHVVDQN